MWFDNSVIYQIYPLGLCGAPHTNDGIEADRIKAVHNYIAHIKELGADCVLFNPLFESDAHGYDTRDFCKVDVRLGTNEDFKLLCNEIHKSGMRIMLDGVFNHVGRGFWAFEDVRRHKWDSRYKDWFHINFDGNSCYNDGFYYEGWEGHYELVKLNLHNDEVKNHIFDAIRFWVEEFGIDGLRLDVAYSLSIEFLAQLRRFTQDLKADFALVGETLHGDYNMWMNDNACHSVTNYECYKGIYSSFNTGNMHEISYSLNRQFGSEHWCLYTGKNLLSFVDNHDVSRIASILEDEQHLPLVYALLFGMPGTPCIYYGSEWGVKGSKAEGDAALRPHIEQPQSNGLTRHIKRLAAARAQSPALRSGSYRNILVQPKQLIFERKCDGDRVLVAINADSSEFAAHFDAGCGTAVDLISGENHDFGGGSLLPAYSCKFWKMEK
ncbi:MAG: maltodextrin glucosidase [Clostridia bacterium]|nr:maltodextrin glucosidase [Clostridia bacterium]